MYRFRRRERIECRTFQNKKKKIAQTLDRPVFTYLEFLILSCLIWDVILKLKMCPKSQSDLLWGRRVAVLALCRKVGKMASKKEA